MVNLPVLNSLTLIGSTFVLNTKRHHITQRNTSYVIMALKKRRNPPVQYTVGCIWSAMRVMRGGLFPHHVLSSNIRLHNGVKIFLKEHLYFHAVSLVDNWTSSLANTGPLDLYGLSGLRPKIGFLMDTDRGPIPEKN